MISLKKKLKYEVLKEILRLQRSVFSVIDKFPDNCNWGYRHVRVAVKKLVENPEIPLDKVIKEIKRSWVCNGENWLIDRGSEYIPLTQKEEDFNMEVAKKLKSCAKVVDKQ